MSENNEIENYILKHMEYVDVTLTVRADDAKLLCRSALAMMGNNYEKEHSKYAVAINNLLTEGNAKQVEKNIVEYIAFIDEYRDSLVELDRAVKAYVARETAEVSANFPLDEKIDLDDFNAQLAEASKKQQEEIKKHNSKIKKSTKRKTKK